MGQDMAMARPSDVQIMNAGRWKSPQMVAHYTKRIAAGFKAVVHSHARGTTGHLVEDPVHVRFQRQPGHQLPSSDVGKKVNITNWQAPSTARYYIAVGSDGTDREGVYWLSITRKLGN